MKFPPKTGQGSKVHKIHPSEFKTTDFLGHRASFFDTMDICEILSIETAAPEQNLQEAFAGESMARNKYTYYTDIAHNAGYSCIPIIIEEIADNEKRHAKDHFKLLGGLGDTKANLKAAIEGEHAFPMMLMKCKKGAL
jgi:rubrerythrin